jgi:hypothetical protein
MVNQLIGISSHYGHIQSSNSQLGRQGFADSIADYPAGVDINDQGQVDKAEKNTDIGLSRPWGFHPQLLAELDVNLSAHPAPIIQSMVNIQGSNERGFSDFAWQSFPIHKLPFVYVHLTVCIFFASILQDTYSNVSRQHTLLIHKIDYNNYPSLSVWS